MDFKEQKRQFQGFFLISWCKPFSWLEIIMHVKYHLFILLHETMKQKMIYLYLRMFWSKKKLKLLHSL